MKSGGMTGKIGRFMVKRELGRGVQSVVYLCQDPHLEREVAIKTLHFAQADAHMNAYLLAEARTVSKLRHANIVPIFEAGEEGGDPYLVFEYVAGQSLAELIRQQGGDRGLEPLQAAEIAASILDALTEAHGQGVIHRDLKPSNIIIDQRGKAHVMDFGIAVRVDAPAPGEDALMGTPAYMAPEYVRQRIIDERTDIHAVGLILLEMLTGERVRKAADLTSLLQQIAEQPVSLPEDCLIDERLGAIVLRALAQDPELRPQTAGQMLMVLRDYISPPLEAEPFLDDAQQTGLARPSAAVEFLLRKLRHKSDFPALSTSILTINRLTHSDKESIDRLSNSILKDYALTAKILRIVNSSHYRRAGSPAISTVSRAVIVLGFDTIRNIALTVMMFEHLQNKANVLQLKEAFLRASLAGLLAHDLARRLMPRETEEAFICAMFHELGQLLVLYYFPDEFEAMRRLMQQKNCSVDVAVQRVLGVSFANLATSVARSWGFPEAVVRSLQPLPGGRLHRPDSREERLHLLTGLSNELCDSMARLPPGDRARALRRLLDRYRGSLGLTMEQLEAGLDGALAELDPMAASLRIDLRQSVFARQALFWAGGKQPAGGSPGWPLDDDLAQTVLPDQPQVGRGQPAPKLPAGRAEAGTGVPDKLLKTTVIAETLADSAPATSACPIPQATEDAQGNEAQAILAAGIQDISNSLVDEFSLNDILRIILETIYRAMGFDRVILCLRDPRTQSMAGRLAFGVDAREKAAHLRFPLDGEQGVFTVATSQGLDLIINDIHDKQIRARIPDWHLQLMAAETFVLFPLMLKGRAMAMIYCDKRRANEIRISPRELALLKTLRNQAVLAIKQAN